MTSGPRRCGTVLAGWTTIFPPCARLSSRTSPSSRTAARLGVSSGCCMWRRISALRISGSRGCWSARSRWPRPTSWSRSRRASSTPSPRSRGRGGASWGSSGRTGGGCCCRWIGSSESRRAAARSPAASSPARWRPASRSWSTTLPPGRSRCGDPSGGCSSGASSVCRSARLRTGGLSTWTTRARPGCSGPRRSR